MPKVKYSPGQGLITLPGTGFVVAGTPIREDIETIAPENAGTATLRNYGITSLDTTAGASGNLTLPDGSVLGQLKTIVLTTDGGDATVEVTNHVDGGGGNSFVGADAGDFLVFIWNGTKWDTVKNTGWTVS